MFRLAIAARGIRHNRKKKEPTRDSNDKRTQYNPIVGVIVWLAWANFRFLTSEFVDFFVFTFEYIHLSYRHIATRTEYTREREKKNCDMDRGAVIEIERRS